MSAQLLIGDAAKLAGVTPKTIRHYHKLGLLVEPERTESGYRLYNAGHLLRLHQIKQLQALGLSLQQIGKVLGEEQGEQSIEDVLRILHAEVVAQIEELQERRIEIEALLSDDATKIFDRADEPPTLKLLQEQLGEALQATPSTWAVHAKQFAQLDALLWNQAEYQKQQRELIAQISAHPEAMRQVLALFAQIAALADEPAHGTEVEELAEEITGLCRENPILIQITESLITSEFSPEMWNELMAEVGGRPLSESQQRLLDLVVKRLPKQRN